MQQRDDNMTLTVPLGGGRDYPIHIGPGLLARAGELIAPLVSAAKGPRAGRIVVITQPPIAARYAETLLDALQRSRLDVQVATFASGERFKTLATVERLYRALYDVQADRKTLIVALGGGVVGDVAGFVAASYLRGMDYVQIPTTLLAMVDSSVGGKTGVDYRDGKNLIGAFHQPRAVLADTDTLRTLPPREIRSGMAEVVKYGAIRDPDLLRFTTEQAGDLRNLDAAALSRCIERSCRIKAEVVAADEREETGLRAILNYGHTIGHALEAATRYRRFRHGEAVAIGMAAAACIGEQAGITPSSVRPLLIEALRAQRLPCAVPPDVPADTLLSLLNRDKKTEAGQTTFVLLKALGKTELVRGLDEEIVRAGLAAQARDCTP